MEVADWQQPWRVPAFGEWNYGNFDNGVDGYTPLTPCFDVIATRMTNAAAPIGKPNERASARGNTRRRQRIPAFGEWNHNSYSNGSWPAASTSFLDLAAAHKPPQTEWRCGENGVAEAKWRPVEAHGRKLSKVADSGAYLSRKSCFTVVAKPVDDDLYGVPLDILYQDTPERSRGWLGMLLMAGCFCRGGTCMA